MFAVANYLSISEGWTGRQEEAEEGWRKRREEGEMGGRERKGAFWGRGIPPVHFPMSHHKSTECSNFLKMELESSLSNKKRKIQMNFTYKIEPKFGHQ